MAGAARILFTSEMDQPPLVAVCVPLHNYGHTLGEALDSVAAQTLREIELVVVDDCSTDASAAVAESWLRAKAGRFGRVSLLQTDSNRGAAHARNVAVAWCRAPYCFMLDADNSLYPRCIGRCLEALVSGGASIAYTIIERFGDEIGLMCFEAWRPGRFAYGSFGDTMALLRKDHLLAAGGYDETMKSAEDYELYCRFVEHGFYGVNVPEILCRYRVHKNSKFHRNNATPEQTRSLVEDMKRRHPWSKLKDRFG